MPVEQKHLFVTVAQDNLELRVRQELLARQVLQEQLVAVAEVELEHDLVLVHLVSVHVMMLLRLNSSICLLADNSRWIKL